MKLFKSKKRAAAIGAAAITLVGGSVAYGYWTASGTGTGSATAGSQVGWNVSTLAFTGTDALAPTVFDGDPFLTGEYTITNTGGGQQLLTKAVIAIDTVTKAGGPGTCVPSDFAIGQSTSGDVDYTETFGQNIAAGNSVTRNVELRLLNNATKNQNDCQGATVNLTVTAS